MDREIKFNVWDGNVYYTWQEIIQWDEGEFEYHFINDKSMIWLQYTGLKDKNGKEIYEGDIILMSDGYSYEIFWDKWCYGIRNLERQAYGILDNKVCFAKIIDNIHENKELKNDKGTS